jgi:hypothetical protein
MTGGVVERSLHALRLVEMTGRGRLVEMTSIDEVFEVLLEGIDVGAQGGDPLRIKSFLNVFLLHACLTHFSQAQMYHFTHCF